MSQVPSAAALSRFERLDTLPLRPVGAPTGRGARAYFASFGEIFRQRELLDLLVRRDLKAKYKDSALGFFWSLVRPLLQLAIYFIVVGQFIGVGKGIPDFAVYVFAGLTAMGLFTETVIGGTASILSNSGLVKKVYLPREVFPLASVGSGLFNFVIQIGVLLLATVLAGAPPLHLEVLYVIPSTLVILVYAIACALLFSAINVYFRDIGYLVEVGTMLLFWASPVVYSWAMVESIVQSEFWLQVYAANPLTAAVIGFQNAFWVAGEDAPQPDNLPLRLAISLGVGIVLVLLSHRAFLRMQGNFAQEL